MLFWIGISLFVIGQTYNTYRTQKKIEELEARIKDLEQREP